MQSDKFDHKVREAAEQHHPSYDENAWARMEKLLDKEMPQKKDRRRVIWLWLVAILLLIGTSWLLIDQPWRTDTRSSFFQPGSREVARSKENKPEKSNDITAKTPGTTPGQSPDSLQPLNAGPATNSDVKGNLQSQRVDKQAPGRKSISQHDRLASELDVSMSEPGKAKRTRKQQEDREQSPESLVPSKTKAEQDGSVAAEPKRKEMAIDSPSIVKTETRISPRADSRLDTTSGKEKEIASATSDTQEKSSVPPANSDKGKKGQSKKQPNSFFLSASLGPDASYVGLDEPGKIKLQGGAGIGYKIGNRISIRTGFYTTHKVYTASKYDYKPTVPIQGYNYLSKIDANCNVYEIPLNVAYYFGKSDKQQLFVSTGLSSFLMKKEVYKYEYRYPNNPAPYYYTKTVSNENKHYFSVLTISGGYERRISRRFSIMAEPYIKLPLGGVGYGKVKLSSVGLQFTANLRLFR